MTTLALTAILAAALVPLIRRDVRRAVARRRRREIRELVGRLRGRGRVRMPREACEVGPCGDEGGQVGPSYTGVILGRNGTIQEGDE